MMSELERIARALCLADGFDPDIKVHPHPLPIGVRGLYMASTVEPVHQWRYYEYYVRGTLDAVLQIPLLGDEGLRDAINEIIGGRTVPEEVNEEQMEKILPNWRQKMGLAI